VCWSIVVKEKLTVGYPFLGAFPSEHTSKATKDVNVHFFIHNFTFRNKLIIENVQAVQNFCKAYQPIPATF